MPLIGGDRRQWLLLGREMEEWRTDNDGQQHDPVSAMPHTGLSYPANPPRTNVPSHRNDHATAAYLEGAWHELPKEFYQTHSDVNGDSMSRRSNESEVPIVSSLQQHVAKSCSTPSAERFDSNMTMEPRNSYYIGWRGGIRLCFLACIFCFVVEVSLLLVAISIGGNAAIGTLYVGSCDKVKSLGFWLLFPLNIVGTLLIASTNYAMQCLSAPSRSELDQAHAKGKYVNVGASSMRNLRYVSQRKHILWWVLGVSTIPIHLFLNSTIFASLQANDYGILIASSNFLQDDSWKYHCLNLTDPESPLSTVFSCGVHTNITQGIGNYSQIDAATCIRRYGNALQSTSSNVVLITTSANGSDIQWPSLSPPSWPNKYDVALKYNMTSGDAVLMAANASNVSSAVSAMYHSTSNGIFAEANDTLWNVTSFGAVFGAFDYRYWTSMQVLDYNFSDPQASTSTQWDRTSWLYPSADLFSGVEQSSQSVSANNWRVTPKGILIDHCYSSTVQDQCELQYSQTMLFVIVICDAIKVVAMLITLRHSLWISDDDPPLITLGDAIDSFLRNPDATTRGRCLATQRDYQFAKAGPRPTGYRLIKHQDAEPSSTNGTEWQPQKHRWAVIPSLSRWIIFWIWTAVLILGVTLFLIWSRRILYNKGLTNIWSQGLGTINPNAILQSTILNKATQDSSDNDSDESAFLASAIISNLPQLCFSSLYFIYNGIATCMLAGREWSTFSVNSTPKSLRVSQPAGHQRSTYWLSLPWRYSFPLLVAMSATHWLTSRSLFIVNINAYDRDGAYLSARSVSAYGFSVLGVILVLTMLVAMPLILFGMSMRRLNPHIPDVGTCSLAISAACHLCTDEKFPALKRLAWGVTRAPTITEPGHCSLSSERTTQPVQGALYA